MGSSRNRFIIQVRPYTDINMCSHMLPKAQILLTLNFFLGKGACHKDQGAEKEADIPVCPEVRHKRSDCLKGDFQWNLMRFSNFMMNSLFYLGEQVTENRHFSYKILKKCTKFLASLKNDGQNRLWITADYEYSYFPRSQNILSDYHNWIINTENLARQAIYYKFTSKNWWSDPSFSTWLFFYLTG